MVVLPALGYMLIATGIEKARTADALNRGPEHHGRIDGEPLHRDLTTLADPGMEGRRTGTHGGRKARTFVIERFERLGLTPLPGGGLERPFSFQHRSVRALWRRDRPFTMTIDGAANVVGMVKGSVPSVGALLIGAHYDHLGVRAGTLYPGADDNASGVAGLLALAGWARDHPLRHDLIFAAFDAEELGLRGSRALLADPAFPLSSLRAVLNLDMIGRSDAGGVTITGTWRHPELRPPVEKAAWRAPVAVFLRHDRPFWLGGFVQDWTTASDHGPFAEVGIPFLSLSVEDHADYHGPGDTAEQIDPVFHAGAVDLALDLLLQLDAR